MKRKKERVDFNRTWEIGLGRTALHKLSHEEWFHCLLALARLMNLLRFAQCALMGMKGTETPFAKRQTINAFTLSCAVLYEAYHNVLPRVGKCFSTSGVYLDGLGAWRSRPDVRSFIMDHCKPLRRTATFHVDIAQIGERLQTVGGSWNRFLSCRGTMSGFYYYDFADLVAMQAFWGGLASVDDAMQHMEALSKTAADATVSFLRSADELISSVISEPPFRLKQSPDTVEPDWVAREIEKQKATRSKDAKMAGRPDRKDASKE